MMSNDKTTTLVEAAREFSRELQALRFSAPVAYVYNPLQYAFAPHAEYLRRYGDGRKPGRTVFLGMNPGPWGMAQTGVPFGAVNQVREWLEITGSIEPAGLATHAKRPITGWRTTRVEVSGDRVWSWARQRFGTPRKFFSDFFVANYCPLLFLDEAGRNLTPDRIGAVERKRLEDRCDAALGRLDEALRPSLWIGVGGYARKCLERAVGAKPTAEGGRDAVRIGQILHPSPASPAANRGWAAAIERQLEALGVELPGL